MHIEHVAIWTADLERLKHFYESYFGATAGRRYANPHKQFTSYFLTFRSGARLELMQTPAVAPAAGETDYPLAGYTHLAFAVGSQEQVDDLTTRLAHDGHPILGGPRWTGDGYYESVILDPDGNRVEITI
ncbi:MAG: VOC family protein [Chloroflexota bacterium]